MPPIRTRSSENRTEQEGRILLALQAIKKQEILSIRDKRVSLTYPVQHYSDALPAIYFALKLAQIHIN